MSPTSWLRRLISPSGLAFVLLCFFMPFLTVSRSGMMGGIAVTYSGFDLAFNGLPSVRGTLASELADSDLDDMRSGVRVLAIMSLVVIAAGIALSVALPSPFPRSVASLGSSVLSVVLVGVNQTVIYGAVRAEIETSSDLDMSVADHNATSGAGFWFAMLLLLAVAGYAVAELVLDRSRAPGRVTTLAAWAPASRPTPGSLRTPSSADWVVRVVRAARARPAGTCTPGSWPFRSRTRADCRREEPRRSPRSRPRTPDAVPREETPAVSPVLRPRVMAIAAVALAVPCAVYLFPAAWALLWVPAVLLAVGALLVRTDASEAAAPDTAAPDTAAPEASDPGRSVPPPRPTPDTGGRGTHVGPIALPSAADDHELDFSAVVHWRWEGHVDLRLRNPGGPAVHAVVRRAAEHAREVDPGNHGIAECELAALLAVEAAVSGAGIAVWAEDVRLRPPDEDVERLRSMAALRKDRVLREAIRAAEEDLAATPRPRAERMPVRMPVPDGSEVEDYEEFVPFDGPAATGGAEPGSDVDGEGYESYWWPAESDGPTATAEQDVQVAIIRGLIDSVEGGAERAAFAREQLRVLEQWGFAEVASRLRGLFSETDARTDPGRPSDV